MIDTQPILLPVLVLVLWSMVQLIWMAATRLPAISAARLSPSAGQRTAELAGQIPEEVQWKADNYNHLMEQPTLFYATAITLAVVGLGTGLNLYLAWLYTGLRVVHSIVQSTTNPVMVRFSLFILGSLALAAMAVNGVMQML